MGDMVGFAVAMRTPKNNKAKKKLASCPECGSKDLVEDSDAGEVACTHCGLVVSDRVVRPGPEWRAYTQEQRDARSHTGLPGSPSVHDKNLSTYVGGGPNRNKDGAGCHLSPVRQQEAYSLRKWQHRTTLQSANARNLSYAMTELDRLTDMLHIPFPIKERAAALYRKVLSHGLVRGRRIMAMSAAVLYAACRLSENPRTLKEFANTGRVSKKELARCYRLILEELDFKVPVCDPIRCVSKIATKVNISMQSQQRAIAILTQLRGTDTLRAKDPMGLAAASLYTACRLEKERKTEKELAEASNMTEVTIRNRLKSLNSALGLLSPSPLSPSTNVYAIASATKD